MRASPWCGGSPAAIPLIGELLEFTPDDWRYNSTGHPLRISVERVLIPASRLYGGSWVWVEGLSQLGEDPVKRRQALVRVDAIPDESRDPNYHQTTTYCIHPDELHPGAIIRVGLRASGSVGHTFALRVATVSERTENGQFRLTGDRLTTAGRPVDRAVVHAWIEDLFPIDIT